MNRRTYFLDQEPQGQPAATPPQPDLMGYPSVEALVQAKRASDAEAKRLHEENLRYQGMIQAGNRQPIPQRASYEEQLETLGIPLEALDQFVQTRAGKVVETAFQPIAQSFQGRNTLLSQYPDYNKFEADVAQFIGSDPTLSQSYQKLFATDPPAAMEYAFLKFGESKRRSAKNDRQGNQASQQMADASIPGGRTGDARGRTAAPEQVELADAREHYNKTRDPIPFAKAVYKHVIRDEFLNQ